MSKTVKQILVDNGQLSTMPKKIKDKWLAALRSGDYEQTTDTLCRTSETSNEVHPDHPGFCCLGVLEHCLTGGVETMPDNNDEFRTVPSDKFLFNRHIKFVDEYGNLSTVPILVYKGAWRSAAELNDVGMSFKQIANLIDKQIEGV